MLAGIFDELAGGLSLLRAGTSSIHLIVRPLAHILVLLGRIDKGTRSMPHLHPLLDQPVSIYVLSRANGRSLLVELGAFLPT